VTAARGNGSGTLQGTLSATATNGLATFINLSHNVATNITLSFSASGLTGTNSSTIAVSPAAAAQLVFTAQPGSTTYGAALNPQPALKTRDQFGNDSAVGLGASQLVTLSVGTGTGSLVGTTSLDIGTAAGNGIVAFSGLQVSMAGTGKQLTASSSGLTSALSSSFNLGQATVTGGITAISKVYDGTTAATIATRSLSGAVPGDDVSLSGGTASFASKAAGTARTVTATGLTLSGATAANYLLASTSATALADITPRPLLVSASGANRVYDGTTAATVTLSDNRVSGDTLSTSYIGASFADKNIGTAKSISVSGISVTGADAANYSANTTATTSASITARSLTVSATGTDKVYDGTTSATVTLSDNRVAGDTLTTSYTSAAFASKNAGAARSISVSGITVSGVDSANYTFNSTATGTANITARSLNVTATGSNKVYDGTSSATVTLADNRLAGDSLSATYSTASFANKNVGPAKTVSVSGVALSGTDAANYSPNSSTSTTADITARSLTVSATGVSKVYDGSTTATVTLSDNRVAGDSLTGSYSSASFADPYVGTNKTISVGGISISGTDAGNYLANTTASATANISAASLTPLVTANNKVYDGTTNATIATRSLSGVLGSDDVSLSGGSANFATKTVGTNKTVSVSGLSLSGLDASNYQLVSTTASTNANISVRSLSVTATASNKVYNGTTSATVALSDNRVAGDTLSVSYGSATFVDKNVGLARTVTVSGISITGTDAPNYSANSIATAAADITAKALTVTASGVNKAYDGSTSANVTLSDNRLAGDSLSTSYANASFATKSVGTGKTISVSGISLSGTDAGNYSANSTASGTANITAKGLTVSGISAADKVYDATTSATLNTGSAALAGVISGDIVTLAAGSATGTFADKNVGTGKTVNVSALSLSGADASNYTLTQPTTTASITRTGLTVTADNQTRAAGQANPTLTASYSGFVGGETLATSGVTGTPALTTTTTNVAGTYPITAALGSLSAANYSFSFVNGVLTVTPASAGSLVVLTQPSSTATAGVPFAQQPAIAIQDAYGNLRSSDNSTVVSVVRNAGSGTLQGTLTATAVNGVATFANLSHNVANTINLSFSSSGLTNATSASIVVSPAAFTQLQLLVPGESAAPGTAPGKTGTPSAQIQGNPFVVTINAVDTFWNMVNTASDTVDLSSSDATADLPADTALSGGTTNLTVGFNATGNFTLTATDVIDNSKGSNTSPAIVVSPAQFTQATGGGAISADGAITTTFTTLTGPTYSENNSGEVGTGTIILNVPAGFVFDTGGTSPTVAITRISSGSSGKSDLVGSVTSVTTTQITYTVTAASFNCTDRLTWQNVRVHPFAGTPLAIGSLTRSGTATVVGMPTGVKLGLLREVPGAASSLAIATQPSATAMAGVALAQQPIIQLLDQFGNFCTNNGTTVVSAARGAGSGTLQGTTNLSAVAGLVTFTNLSHNVATNITLTFSASGAAGTNSSTIAIFPAAASQLVFATQPGSSTYGSALNPQPVLQSQDNFGNISAVGLGASQMVTVSLGSGTGSLLGSSSLDIGTAAGNGIVAFSGLQVTTAGTNKQLSASAIGLTSALSSTFAVNPATITGSITVNSKIYDGTTAATIATRALSGVLGGDNVNLSGGAASFASKSVGAAKTVTASGLSLSGSDAGNYQLASTSASAVADITVRSLTVNATGVNKTYDGTTAATVTLADNRVAGDSLTASYTSASFADRNIGTAKPVSVSGISISGADAGNYTANTTASTTANITAKALTITATGINRVYDGTVSATVTLSDNRVAGDSLSTSYTGAGFASKTAGTNKTVSVSGISLTGTDAANYTFNSTASTTANISARSLSVTATGVNKVYNGLTSATVTLADNRLAGDSLTSSYSSASFADKNVGTAKGISVSGITISGTDAANYSANTMTSASADITIRSLTVTATGVNKAYDGTTGVTVALSDNRIAGDSLSTSYTTASFADPYVGTAKPVSVSGISISGTDAPNYSANTTASTTANITTASLNALVTINNKVYDGTTNATIATRGLSGVAGSDDVSLSGGSASFATKAVGISKPVTVTGLSLSGADAANYQLASTTVSTNASITARSLSVTATGISKVYNGLTSATVTLADNRVAGDTLTSSYSSASFADKNVGAAKAVSVSGISISGADALNYSANTTASTTADITARTLTITATGNNKIYDGTTNATVLLSDNRVAGDSLTTTYSSASFANKSVGTNKPVSVSTISISGTDAQNYSANSTASATANITAKTLTVTGITAADKVYDATTTASLNTVTGVLAGVISGDTVTLNAASALAAFADKNVGSNKTVTVSALSLSGADAGNYALTQPTATASISKAGLTVTADNKSRAAGQSNPTLTASYSGFAGGETLATSGVTGSPALSTTSTNIAGTYPITAAVGTLSAANYSFSFVNGVLTVTPASANSLVILTQPSSSATAGVPFAQQPAIAIKDAYGNVLNTNGLVVTATRNAGSGILHGTLSATAVNGVATFVNLSHNVANTINLTFSSSGLTDVNSANVIVSPAAFTQLQLLVPGETAAPGSASGKTGTPNSQIVGLSFAATVNAVDSFWNLVNTVSDTVGLSSSDISATLPPATALLGGITNPTVYLNTTGSFTITATDLTDGTKAPSTSPSIVVSPAQFTPATGGSAIAADGATGTFTTLTGPSYSENNPGEVGLGTIILKAPSGFVFDTAGTAPTVLSMKISGSGNNPVQGSVTSVTTTQIVYTVTATSSNPSQLTWQNVRVRPTSGTLLASGNLTRSGTASVVGLPVNANLGFLREVPGAPSTLVIVTQPSATAVAGVAFAQQPVIRLQDQFGTFCTNNNSTVVSAARSAGSGILQGATNVTAVAGIVGFTNLSHNVATNITVAFSAPGATTTNSSSIAISAAAASQLVFSTQPGSSAYGSSLSPQPVLKTRDAFGNDSTVGLGSSRLVNLSVSSGTGSLLGTSSLDIGTAAGNGTVTFSGLQVSTAGTNKQLSASATGLSNALSSAFAVNPVTVTGSITANNKIYDGTTAATIATRALSGVIGSDDVSLSGGTANFASKTVGTAKTVTATGLTLSGLTAGNYQLASTTASALASITVRSLTVSATGVNRAYDGTTATTVTLSDNRVAGDSLTTSYSSASFADKNVGTAKTVSVSGISISGTDALNYSANTTATTTANITARSLTVSATGANKVYDGTTSTTVTLSDNRVSGDNLTTSYSSASFATKSVGTNKTVSVSGISLTGTDAANYTFNSTTSTTANITARSMTITATGVNKVYDGTTTATVSLADNRVAGDSLSTSYTNASFATKNVGTARTVSVSGISISGADAANYSANTTASTTADVTVRSLTVTASGVNKVYDRTTSATVTLSDNRVTGDSLSRSYTSASFADPYVGTAKPVSVSGISISGTDAANYSANTTASTSANITGASVTAVVIANNKIYDGTTSATITRGLNGVLGSDDVSLSGGTASFASKTVGTNKSVSVTGLSLSGADAANYQLASTNASTTANITARSLSVTATGVNKVYNGTTAATVTLSDNRVAGDSLTTSYTSANFADKNVGTVKSVSVSGISISGTDALNYSANTSTSTTADITARSLSVTATAVNKVYDGSTNATVTLSDNRVAGDSLTSSFTSASFADKNVGTAKTVSISGISISGTDAANYTANTTATATANITGRSLTVTATGTNKVYDGNTTATVTLSDDRLAGDSLTTSYTSASFASKAVGTARTITVSGINVTGTDAGNYTFNTTASTTANITTRSLSVTATGIDKVYDGSTTATLNLADNRVAGDTLTTSYTSATFASKNVGTARTVSVSGITISGADAANYSANTSASTTANITARSLIISATAVNKVYDGTTSATITLSDNRLAGDSLTTSYTSASFANKNVGVGKSVSVTGISISGTDAANYSANSTASTTANITMATVTALVSANNKVYDGTTTATLSSSSLNGVLGSDDVSLTGGTATFATKSVSTGKTVTVSGLTLSGTDAANYSLGSTSATTTADITPRTLTVSATALNKMYDGTTSATVTLSDNRVAGDSLTTSYTSATFANKNVGTARTVSISGISISGSDAANYSANTSASTTANITPASVTALVSANNKVYDGTTAATLASRALSGVLGSDDVSLTGGTAAFASKSVGIARPVTVSGLNLSGADAANYQLGSTSANTTADITALTVTVSGVTANNKAYDGTTSATLRTNDIAFTGLIGAEMVELVTNGYTAAFASPDISTNIPVTISGLTLTGSDATNYTLAQPTDLTANITASALTVTGITANNKVYDGTTAATLNLGGAMLNGAASGDIVTLDTSAATGTFANKNVGTTNTVTVSGLALGGTNAGNYTLTQPTATANITPAPLTPTITAASRGYDGTTAATITARTLTGVIGSDDVSLVGGTASFADKNVGIGKTVTATGLELSSADADNYQLASTSTSTTANITTRAITVRAATDGKSYDGTTNSSAAALITTGSLADGDSAAWTQSFDNKNVGTGKTLTPNGSVNDGNGGANYTITFDTASAGTITTRALTVSATGVNKVYDGTTTATVTLSDDRVAGDVLALGYTAATFADANAGSGKPVNVSGITVTGTDSGNYTFNSTTTTTADITQATLVALQQLVGALKNHSVSVRTQKLLANGTNQFPTYTLQGVSANSTNGGTVTVSGGLVTYTPPTNFIGADLFTYTITDGSSSATGSVQVVVADTGTLAPNRIGVVIMGTDGAHARFAGIPGFTYSIERSTDGTNWTAIGTAVVPPNGLLEIVDTDPPSGSVFYRTTVP
jgi:hypothetical protein